MRTGKYVDSIPGNNPNYSTEEVNFRIGEDNARTYFLKPKYEPEFRFTYDATLEKFLPPSKLNKFSEFCVFYCNLFIIWDKMKNEEKFAYIVKYIEAVKNRELDLLFKSDPKICSEVEKDNVVACCDEFLYTFDTTCPKIPTLNGWQTDKLQDAVNELCEDVKTRRNLFVIYS